MRIAVVGAGNVATSLSLAMKSAGMQVVALWSRSEASVRLLCEKVAVPGFTNIEAMPDADVVIISVTDNALPHVASMVAERYKHALVLHTAGSVQMDVLADAGCASFGVLYPMQTFSKVRVVDFSSVSVFVEGCNEAVATQVEQLAMLLTDRVYRATSEQRAYLHLAAVFACNFSNAVYSMAAEILECYNLPFSAMLPLIEETAAKVHAMMPREAQTGPAKRGDTDVMDKQRAMLDGELRQTYDLMSEYIQKQR